MKMRHTWPRWETSGTTLATTNETQDIKKAREWQVCDFKQKILSLQSHILPWWWNGRHEGLRHVL